MYLLETNHCNRAIIGDSKIINSLQEREKDLVVTCAIAQGELIDMAERSQNDPDKQVRKYATEALENLTKTSKP